MPLISILLPVYNEEGNVERAHAEISEVFAALPEVEIEFIFADNHSTDDTFSKLEKIAARDPRVRVLRYARNFGFNRSVLTGYRHARGDAAIQIDCDLEDPPAIMLEFVRLWRAGHDVVVGVRAQRQESWLLSRARRLYYRLIDAISEEDHETDAGDFRLIDRRILNQLRLIRDAQPYVRGLVSGLARNQGAVRYARNKRQAGESKFRLKGLVRLALEGIFAQSTVPLKLATVAGFAIAFLTAILSGVYLVLRLLSSDWPQGFATTQILILFGISLNAIFLGIIGEYVGRIYIQIRDRPLVVIERTINVETAEHLTFPQAQRDD
jgi:glycosyltransferase involved in cell wall biosynthesis